MSGWSDHSGRQLIMGHAAAWSQLCQGMITAPLGMIRAPWGMITGPHLIFISFFLNRDFNPEIEFIQKSEDRDPNEELKDAGLQLHICIWNFRQVNWKNLLIGVKYVFYQQKAG